MQTYSVLMSVYQKENPEYFRTAIDSMINQTARPDEIVIVEDGPLTEALYRVIGDVNSAQPEHLLPLFPSRRTAAWQTR